MLQKLNIVATILYTHTQFFIKLKDPRHSRAFWVNRALKQSILIIIIHIHSTLIQRSSCKNFIHIILANSANLTKGTTAIKGARKETQVPI